MIKSLYLRNFRCFHEHSITFQPSTVIVGQNNAGKSSLLEALRLIGRFVDHYPEVNFYEPERGWNLPRRSRVLKPSTATLGLDIPTIYYRYEPTDVIVEVTFTVGVKVKINIRADGAIFGEVFGPDGRSINSRAEARQHPVPSVSICPGLSTLARNEAFLNADYVRGSMLTSLSSIHFRNELNLFPDRSELLKVMVEETWRGVRIRSLDSTQEEGKTAWSLMIQDGDFVAEAGSMGHGLQMWLQIMWFLVNCSPGATVIVDEPDVYIHPDLQHALMRKLRSYRQMIVATHSTEVLSDVLPENVLVLDRSKRRSSYSTSLPGVQRVIENIGSAHTLQFARLHSAKCCLFVEGNDVDLLKCMHATIFPQSKRPLNTTPRVSMGGRAAWNYVIGAALLLENAEGEPVKLYCILDRDLHSNDEIAGEQETASRHGFNLHVWAFRELENYLLVPETICRIICEIRADNQGPSLNDVQMSFDTITEQIKDSLVDELALHIHSMRRNLAINTVNQQARQLIADEWPLMASRLKVIDAKKMLSMLSAWAKDQYGVSFSARRIAQSLRLEEIHPEVRRVLGSIERLEQFVHS